MDERGLGYIGFTKKPIENMLEMTDRITMGHSDYEEIIKCSKNIAEIQKNVSFEINSLLKNYIKIFKIIKGE